jgi:site-specific recombinase XerD
MRERKARLMEINADPFRQTPPDDKIRITIEEAVRDFLADEQARQLAKTTTCQSRTLLGKQLLPWAKSQSLLFLDQLTTPKLREFRALWNNSALTSQRKHHRLNTFFDFCIENEWVIRNPAKRMKAVHVSPIPTDYFTPAEFAKIVDATYTYGEWKGGRDFEHRSSICRLSNAVWLRCCCN